MVRKRPYHNRFSRDDTFTLYLIETQFNVLQTENTQIRQLL